MSYQTDHLFSTIFENTCILLHSKQAASDVTWGEYLKQMSRTRFTSTPKVLVFTDGSGPTPPQRQLLSQATTGITYFCAVVGESAVTRFIVASLALANPHTRSFYTNQMQQVFEYLKLSEPQTKKLVETLKLLSEQIPNVALSKAIQQ
jgi:hypothetical protein